NSTATGSGSRVQFHKCGWVLSIASVGMVTIGFVDTHAWSGPKEETPKTNAAASQEYEQVVRPFIAQYCLKCHGEEQAKAGDPRDARRRRAQTVRSVGSAIVLPSDANRAEPGGGGDERGTGDPDRPAQTEKPNCQVRPSATPPAAGDGPSLSRLYAYDSARR